MSKLLIDSTELQQKILDCISSGEMDELIDSTVFKDDPQAKSAAIWGMTIAAMYTLKCEHYQLEDDDYKQRFLDFCRLTDKLKDAFLGPDYYINCSCGEPQASEIIIDEIIRKYALKKEARKSRLINSFRKRGE